jgi:L-2,4-diaminobutyrate decarboxylase
MFETHFFGRSPASLDAYQTALRTTLDVLSEALPQKSYDGGPPLALAARLSAWRENGGTWDHAWADLREIIASSVAVYHPHTCAHLHCPVVIPALCAEVVITALNQSMDSYDQSGAGTLIEQQVGEWVSRLIGYDKNAGVTFTTGGTQSNYMGLLLARDRFIRDRWDWSVQRDGLPPHAVGKLKILCSEAAHFSVVKAAHQLGLGANAVITVPTDADARLLPEALARQLDEQQAAHQEVFALVATAGTTDAGAFDPISPLAEIAARHRLWLHVDAAWGGVALLSPRHKSKLHGLERADSVTLDFHKGFYQPVSCSAFSVRDAASFELIRHHADYLNPAEHEENGVPDLVTHSLLTTRRFDSLKLWLTLRTVGVETLGAMLDHTLVLARNVAYHLKASAAFELCCEPAFGSVLFRLRAQADDTPESLEALHAQLPSRLLHAGRGVIGFSKWRGCRCLKFTLLNPCTELRDLVALLDTLLALANQTRRELSDAHSQPYASQTS